VVCNTVKEVAIFNSVDSHTGVLESYNEDKYSAVNQWEKNYRYGRFDMLKLIVS